MYGYTCVCTVYTADIRDLVVVSDMCCHVPLKVSLDIEMFKTHFTMERLLASVYSHMLLHLPRALKYLTAVAATVLLPGIDVHYI